jgi:hypothetical protein
VAGKVFKSPEALYVSSANSHSRIHRNEVPLETVSLVLGHKKLVITEKHHARLVSERQALIENQVRKMWARPGATKK